jgi:hypothetical protein
MTRLLLNCALQLTVCAAVVGGLSMPCFAQNSSSTGSNKQGAPAPNQQAAAADQRTAILQELEEMKKRIAELEAQLKKQDQQTEQSKNTTPPAKVSELSITSTAAPTASTVDSGALNAKAGHTTDADELLPPATSLSPATSERSESSSLATAAQESTSIASQAPQKPAKIEPFSDHDWTWLNGNPRTETPAFDSKFFTPEVRVDTTYTFDFNRPIDHSMDGSTEVFRSQEVQLEDLGVGGNFHYDNVEGRILTQFGMYSQAIPRNDPSPGNGQYSLSDAYRYISEGYGGYHWNVLHGVNIDAGIFMSYIGLFSFYNFDNWAYQPSYVSSNTPWFFNGLRVQIFPTAHLKIEPWFINGWQAYGSANHSPGIGGQIKWTPTGYINVISNNYGVGEDDLFTPGRRRIHTDDSIEVKYFDQPENTLDKLAFTLTGDMGCEYGAGVSCHGDTAGGPKQSFIGFMAYNRFWFHKDLFAMTVGGGRINNPGRYLVLLPPINGETAITASTNSPYFTENPGNPFKAWDSSYTFDYMPSQYVTFRWEYDYRHANVPYWTGRGGITPPGGNNGFPEDYACITGASSGQMTLAAAEVACGGGISSIWFPDLRKDQSFIDMDILVKF